MSFIIKKVEADDDTVKHADGWHGVILKNILAPSVEKNNVPVGVLTDMLAKYAALSLADGKTVCEPQSTGPLPRPIGWLSSWKRVASPFIAGIMQRAHLWRRQITKK